MTTYHAQHADLFRAVAEILVRDYIAQSETAETVAEWIRKVVDPFVETDMREHCERGLLCMEPSELASLISDVEGYEKR